MKRFLKVTNNKTGRTSIVDVTFDFDTKELAITPLNGKGVISFNEWLIIFRDFVVGRKFIAIEWLLKEEFKNNENSSEAFFSKFGREYYTTTYGVVEESVLNHRLSIKKRKTATVHITQSGYVQSTRKLIPLLKIWNHFNFSSFIKEEVGTQIDEKEWAYPSYTVLEFVPAEYEFEQPQKFCSLDFLGNEKKETKLEYLGIPVVDGKAYLYKWIGWEIEKGISSYNYDSLEYVLDAPLEFNKDTFFYGLQDIYFVPAVGTEFDEQGEEELHYYCNHIAECEVCIDDIKEINCHERKIFVTKATPVEIYKINPEDGEEIFWKFAKKKGSVDYLENQDNWEAAFCFGLPTSKKEPPTYLQGYQKGCHFYVGRGFWEKETFPIARKELKND